MQLVPHTDIRIDVTQASRKEEPDTKTFYMTGMQTDHIVHDDIDRFLDRTGQMIIAGQAIYLRMNDMQ